MHSQRGCLGLRGLERWLASTTGGWLIFEAHRELFMLCVCGLEVGGWGGCERDDTDECLGDGVQGENDQ